jgi:hypothetical protein
VSADNGTPEAIEDKIFGPRLDILGNVGEGESMDPRAELVSDTMIGPGG